MRVGAGKGPSRHPACHPLHRHARPSQPQHFTQPANADISELDLPANVRISFPHGMDHISQFEVALTPGE